MGIPCGEGSEETIYTASLTYEADQNPDNNTSTGKRVRIELPVYPSVTDLDAKREFKAFPSFRRRVHGYGQDSGEFSEFA